MILQADARHIPLASESVNCVVTSPPYWGLRDYSVPNQIGLAPTPESYLSEIVAVFREVRRVCRRDATVWLNLGDSYAGSWGNYHPDSPPGKHGQRLKETARWNRPAYSRQDFLPPTANVKSLKPKDLCGIPWRVALALQADGWYLRSDIIWAKPNPMPESVTDRPTKAHEYIFLLAKNERYYYDQDAVREPAVTVGDCRFERTDNTQIYGRNGDDSRKRTGNPTGESRNLRSVWTMATQPFPDAHFATFPEELAKRCILAGTSERGYCAECGAPWERVVESEFQKTQINNFAPEHRGINIETRMDIRERGINHTTTLGWQPTCPHNAPTKQGVVLDPFCGSGTTVKAAKDCGRKGIGLDLKLDYLKMAQWRSAQEGLGI